MSYGGPGGGGGDALQKVKAPAMTLLITTIVFTLIGLVAFFAAPQAMGSFYKQLQDMQAKQGGPPLQELPPTGHTAFDYIMLVVGLVVAGVIVFGAMQMQQLKSYPLAMAASILSMIPFLSPCCCVGIPVGIWALVVLLKPEVKSAFTS